MLQLLHNMLLDERWIAVPSLRLAFLVEIKTDAYVMASIAQTALHAIWAA